MDLETGARWCVLHRGGDIRQARLSASLPRCLRGHVATWEVIAARPNTEDQLTADRVTLNGRDLAPPTLTRRRMPVGYSTVPNAPRQAAFTPGWVKTPHRLATSGTTSPVGRSARHKRWGYSAGDVVYNDMMGRLMAMESSAPPLATCGAKSTGYDAARADLPTIVWWMLQTLPYCVVALRTPGGSTQPAAPPDP